MPSKKKKSKLKEELKPDGAPAWYRPAPSERTITEKRLKKPKHKKKLEALVADE